MARIIMLISEFPKLSETFIQSKFQKLLAEGWDIHIVCHRSNSQDWQFYPDLSQLPDAQRRVHTAWPQRPRWLALLLLPLALFYGLLRAPLASLRYLHRGWLRFGLDTLRCFYLDLQLILLQPALLHFEFGALAPERMYLKELLGCKILVSFRGYDLNFVGLEDPQHYQPVWQHADALHLLGQDLWQRALRRGCPAEKPHILIPPAIDLNYFSLPPRSVAEDADNQGRPLRILSVGRLEWKKGYEYAFQAIRLLIDRGIACEYRVIGDGEYFEPLAFTRHQLGLTSTIELLGAQPKETVRAQLAWADVFLHAAVSEGFCNAVIEAQAMGVPVVTSDADGLSENVLDGVTGFVVPRRNAAELAGKIEILMKDLTLRKRMGLEGRHHAVASFGLNRLIDEFSILYRWLLAPDLNKISNSENHQRKNK
jgi:colanic acid/amylovoran biosynthesis glycosyltransferase